MTVLGNTLGAWSIAAGAGAALAALLLFVKHALVRRLKARAGDGPDDWHGWMLEILRQTRWPFLVLLGLLVGLQFLELPARATRILEHVTVIVVLVQAALWGNRAIALWIARALAARREADAGHAMSMSIIGFVARIALWTVLLLMVLDNLGVNITALVASLGIGGIAVALAVQNILGDVFASLSIVLDKPFVIGDFIIVDDVLGTVEYVGLKTTRVRSLSGEQVVFSNADLLKSRIRNYKRMFERRVVFGFGVTYDTPRAKLERIPPALRTIIEAIPSARFDRAHFKSWGDFALQFEVVYYVLDPDFNRYMDIQQRINLELHDWCRNEGVKFAFPTTTVLLQQTGTGRPST
jgi:small-conductance mechanosensitive channel